VSALFAVIFMAVFVTAFGAFLVWGTGKLGPKRLPNAVRDMPYESGLPGEATKTTNISVKFYLTAILFILFDIEIIFM
jgi:NADH-quinone oxidoreductase subunit A